MFSVADQERREADKLLQKAASGSPTHMGFHARYRQFLYEEGRCIDGPYQLRIANALEAGNTKGGQASGSGKINRSPRATKAQNDPYSFLCGLTLAREKMEAQHQGRSLQNCEMAIIARATAFWTGRKKSSWSRWRLWICYWRQ